jgi:hypothetical protein
VIVLPAVAGRRKDWNRNPLTGSGNLIMNRSLKIGRFSFRAGGRSAHQAKAQERACIMAVQPDFKSIPGWNNLNREHLIAGSVPSGTRAGAAVAVKEPGGRRTTVSINVTNNLYERHIKPLFIGRTKNA